MSRQHARPVGTVRLVAALLALGTAAALTGCSGGEGPGDPPNASDPPVDATAQQQPEEAEEPGSSAVDVRAARDCPPPVLTLTPTEATVGQLVRVEGTNYLEGCGAEPADLTLGPTGGDPLAAHEVVWQQSRVPILLGAVTADDAGTFVLEITVPADAVPGPAEVSVGEAVPAVLVVR
jgi:hypothetical protein